MKTLQLKLRNCYGIRSLDAEFDFSQHSVTAIYAPNGSMKSSLANTFADLREGRQSRDRIFEKRETVREITDETGSEIRPEEVMVLPPYSEVFGDSAKTSTLLVDAKLRARYEASHRRVDQAKAELLTALRKQAGLRQVEAAVSSTFMTDEESFLPALRRIKDEVRLLGDSPLADVPYKTLFDAKVISFLAEPDVQAAVAEYIKTYKQLIASSVYFRRGVFGYHNAAAIAKVLASNGFFEANHSLTLNGRQSLEIASEEQLLCVVESERKEILQDAQLMARFAKLESLMGRNANLRELQEYLAENEHILPQLGNVDRLREDVWKAYLKVHQSLFDKVLATDEESRDEQRAIEEQASQQRTQWEAVIGIFNDRFYVPFQLKALNRTSAILGEALLSLGFVFNDGEEDSEVGQPELLAALSQGEKKALYILNVLFEVEIRKRSGQPTLFIVDDIADSFDYKNKYAIIQYLKDIAERDGFRLVLLTHNFDFFRTAQSRFVPYQCCLQAKRTETGIALEQASGIQNVFVLDWKRCLHSNLRKRIASIPFVRNLIEYTRGKRDPQYGMLTKLLHWSPLSEDVSHSQLDHVFRDVFSDFEGQWKAPEGLVLECVLAEANSCLGEPEGASLENKIVLAMAIRIVAEKVMVEAIDDQDFVDGIKSNQTGKLYEKVRAGKLLPASAIQILDRVVLMTPENIHLNSFMYEPILDMSDQHLRQLYEDVRGLAV